MQNTMQVDVAWGSIFLLFLGAILLYCLFKFNRGLLTAIGWVVFIFVLLCIPFWFLSTDSVVVTENTSLDAVHSSALDPKSIDPSLEQLWNRLTESRIDLDSHAVSESQSATVEGITLSKEDSPAEEEQLSPEEEKPAWLDMGPMVVGNVYSRVINSGPYKTIGECHQALEPLLRQAVAERMEMLVRADQGLEQVALPALDQMGVGVAYILQDICRKEHQESITTSVGKMKQAHVLLEFRQSEDSHLLTSWRNYIRQQRLENLGIAVAACLGLLTLGYVGLSVDTWTRGYYTKWLILGATTAIIFVVVLMIA